MVQADPKHSGTLRKADTTARAEIPFLGAPVLGDETLDGYGHDFPVGGPPPRSGLPGSPNELAPGDR